MERPNRRVNCFAAAMLVVVQRNEITSRFLMTAKNPHGELIEFSPCLGISLESCSAHRNKLKPLDAYMQCIYTEICEH
jgi:hypothetical protein